METKETAYEVRTTSNVPIKSWTKGVPVEEDAKTQLANIASMPFVYKWVAAMPDCHLGKGATVGSVIATDKAIIPAAVGVDIGCGMMAVRTSLQANDLPDNLKKIRHAIEREVPHGRTNNGRRGDTGAWRGRVPSDVAKAWHGLEHRFKTICAKHDAIERANTTAHLGTLGTGNHFIEVCLDETDQVWFMLHSGSRGVGNRIGSYFISLAKKEMEKWFIHLPDKDLAYFAEGSEYFSDYVEAVDWAQDFAAANRRLMMDAVIKAVRSVGGIKGFTYGDVAVNCHHNYVQRERHYGKNVLITRKGAVSAREDQLGIIPGSMGARSYIVRGLGNRESFTSCSHGAGRKMSRTEAKRTFSVDDHVKATEGIECRKDRDVIDETPMAYKDIDDVMAAQKDLVEPVHTLRQIICVKG